MGVEVSRNEGVGSHNGLDQADMTGVAFLLLASVDNDRKEGE